MTLFIRLLASPISTKGADLRQQIAALNQGQPAEGVFQANPAEFAAIPGTPFAYWAQEITRNVFLASPALESDNIHACSGTNTGDDFRFIRIFWEVEPKYIGARWHHFPKGGAYACFYSSIPLIIDWGNDGDAIRATGYIRNPGYYFRPGLTWSARTTSKLSVRCLPAGCIFSHKGLVIIVENDNQAITLSLLSVLNSVAFQNLVETQLAAATAAARSYEVGVIQQTPIPARLHEAQEELAGLAQQAYNLARQPSIQDETSHVFCLPALLSAPGASLAARLQSLSQAEAQRQAALAALQAQIDARVAELYGVPELAAPQAEPIALPGEESSAEQPAADDVDDDEEEPAEATLQPANLVADLLSWCVGAAFGRWDVRYALHPQSLPALPGPFDPLPVCSPGMLTGQDGLPLDAAPEGYPLPVAWDGFLVDDPGHARDIVLAVQRVLQLLWPQTADAIEAEACQILGVPDLRAWLRDPKGFFAYHIKRYSKSRRKAPIYWLLQSAKRNYGIWLYYPRLNPDSLFRAGREYADAKLSLEICRLKDFQAGLAAAVGSARKVQERKVAAQEGLVAELKSFQKDLDAAAMLELKPDLNDGVLLNIAPLYALVPWKEAERTWQELLRGKYEWSSMSQWLRHKGLVKG